MAKVSVKELETADYDLLENIKTSFVRLWRQKVIILIISLLAFCASFVYVGVVGIQTTYYTTAAIYSVAYGSSNETNSGVLAMNQYASLISTSRVCERAAITLAPYGISAQTIQNMAKNGMISLGGASTKSGSYGYRLVLQVRGADATNLVAIANAMANAFSGEINDLIGTEALQVMDEAQNVYSSQSISMKMCMLLFTAVGFVGSCGVIFIKEFFTSKVYSVGQCESDKKLVLGIIPYSNS